LTLFRQMRSVGVLIQLHNKAYIVATTPVSVPPWYSVAFIETESIDNAGVWSISPDSVEFIVDSNGELVNDGTQQQFYEISNTDIEDVPWRASIESYLHEEAHFELSFKWCFEVRRNNPSKGILPYIHIKIRSQLLSHTHTHLTQKLSIYTPNRNSEYIYIYIYKGECNSSYFKWL